MTAAQWPFKCCSGAHCHVRDTCLHHALPTTDPAGLAYPAHPVVTSEDCMWFDAKHAGWGEGGEHHGLD